MRLDFIAHLVRFQVDLLIRTMTPVAHFTSNKPAASESVLE